MPQNQNLFSYYLDGGPEKEDAIAIHTGAAGYSYADLAKQSARYAHALLDEGAHPGERICAYVDKSASNVFLYLACLRAGLVYQPLNPALRPAEVEYYLADADPAVVICSAENEAWIRKTACRRDARRVLTLNRDATGALPARADAAATDFPTRCCEGGELACLLYSSGTTGKPKGIRLSHANLGSNLRTLVDLWGFTSGDVLIHALPLFHVHGLFVALGCVLAAGASLHLLERFDAGGVIGLLPRSTVFMGVPTFYTRLLRHPALGREGCGAMRVFISGSAPLHENTFHEFKKRTGHAILERYGASETGMSISNPLDGERRAGVVGKPLPGVLVEIVDNEGNETAAGGIGELLVKGPGVFSGYWNLKADDRAAFTDAGYFRTGDLAKRDADGYISIMGRSRDLIISGGENIYPAEIEQCLDRMEGVTESAVVGLHDSDLGEKVVAALVITPGSRPHGAELLSKLKTQLAGFKIPKQICFVDELPRNTMGKVQKNKLRETLEAMSSSGE